MQALHIDKDVDRYSKCIETSKSIRWEIDRDVIRGRALDHDKRFLPDSLSKVNELEFLGESERRLLSQIQGRTYANMFGLVERFIGAQMLELTRDHQLGNQTKLEALVRFTDEELKHQELFRRLELMTSSGMPEGYQFLPKPNDVATFVLGKSTWSVLALTCHIELFTLSHYQQSLQPTEGLSELFRDVFRFHWLEESQHAILDELEWERENRQISAPERDLAVDDFIELVRAVDGLLQLQAASDTDYFLRSAGRAFSAREAERLGELLQKAYRWQFIVSGVQGTRFAGILAGMVTPEQADRVGEALAPLMG